MHQVEADPDCQKVLACRMRDGMLNDCPFFSDVRSYHPNKGEASGLLAGFPCQVAWPVFGSDSDQVALQTHKIKLSPKVADEGVSKSGNQLGYEDERSCLVDEVYRVIDEAELLLS